MLNKVVIVGSGNVAWHLAHALHHANISILQIYSRNIFHAKRLADRINAEAIDTFEVLSPTADAYILALADDVQESFAQNFPFSDKLLIHTSGSLSIDILSSNKKSGVFYPLQTFSKDISLIFSEIPICIEASSEEIEKQLVALAKVLNCMWFILDSEKRKTIHLAAVFGSNFTNHMIAIAEHILNSEKITHEIIYPLINQTIKKIPLHSANLSQTGPAVRNDKKIMEKHISLLSDTFPEFSELYKTISNSIFEFKNRKTDNNDTSR
jgi:predicted short-subunit dehydrogenase-like oxidoreductase (DUF2520 family)